MDGNAIWYSVRLGLEQDRARDAVDRLIGSQWPDGGWSCDKRREATHSSFQESLIPARGLWAYGLTHDYAPALEAAQRVADQILARRLLWHRSDDSLIVPDNITIVPLPAKCPELNPQENVWQFMRDNWLSNRVFANYDAIVEHCCHAWNKFAAQPWKIISIGYRTGAHGF